MNILIRTPSKLGTHSYFIELREQRSKMNVKAIIIGTIGSTIFFASLILLKAFNVASSTVAIVLVSEIPVLMFCWGYALWNFIKIARINTEMKYLEKLELAHITTNQE